MSSKISWTDQTWNPIVGCSKCSPGCKNCYAERMARRQAFMRPVCEYADVVGESGWNGKTALVKSALTKPLHWKKPRRIFVCSMGDLFHESVPFEWIDQVFAIMALCPQYTFQLLTKRAERMADYIESLTTVDGAYRFTGMQPYRAEQANKPLHKHAVNYRRRIPLPNVWLGTTCENQEQADRRIPHLLRCPAAVRFISVEPMLSDLDPFTLRNSGLGHIHVAKNIDWVICGGESGPNARPMHPDWVRSLRDQCVAAVVPFHFKQWGEWAPDEGLGIDMTRIIDKSGVTTFLFCGWGREISERGWHPVRKVGKSRAGCLIDDQEWKQFPEVTP